MECRPDRIGERGDARMRPSSVSSTVHSWVWSANNWRYAAMMLVEAVAAGSSRSTIPPISMDRSRSKLLEQPGEDLYLGGEVVIEGWPGYTRCL